MKWSFAATGMIVLGIIGLAIIFLFEQITTNNESDYYLLKEICEAAMIDSVDIGHYRVNDGELRIVPEKFVENFVRRFANSTLFSSTGYIIEFHDIMDKPPKASIIIKTGVTDYTMDYKLRNKDNEIKVVNNLTGILEFADNGTYKSKPSDKMYTSATLTKTYYFASSSATNITSTDAVPGELKAPNIRNIKFAGVSGYSGVTSQEDLSMAILNSQLYFGYYDDNAYMCSNYGGTVNVSGSGENVYITTGSGCSAAKFNITWSYEKYPYS